jgi:uncharacterized protein
MSIRPSLCTTYEGGHADLLERVLPLIEYLEVTPDTISYDYGDRIGLNQSALAQIKEASQHVKIVVHGVGLSIGSHDGWSSNYIRLLDEFMENVDVAWHSEHLGYTMVDGESLGTMLPVPKTEEALDLVCERVTALQERYRKPFLLENVIHLLPEPNTTFSEASFVNTLVDRTECGLIVDVYNLECDAHNNAFDMAAYLSELNMRNAWEIHVAGGVEQQGFKLDIHSDVTNDSTLAWADYVINKANGTIKALTYEILDEAVTFVGYDGIENELKRLRQRLSAY